MLRLRGTLDAYGFVQSSPRDGTYELGGTLFRLGSSMQDRFSRMEAKVRPVLKRLVADTGDTAFFSTIEGLRRVVVLAEESQDALRFTAREGQTRPLHVGATSKLLLAHADAETRDRAFDLVPESEQAALINDLKSILDRGFAVSKGEVTPHGFAIAVPVRRSGSRVDAISLAGVLSKLSPELVSGHVQRLLEEADLLEKALFLPAVA